MRANDERTGRDYRTMIAIAAMFIHALFCVALFLTGIVVLANSKPYDGASLVTLVVLGGMSLVSFGSAELASRACINVPSLIPKHGASVGMAFGLSVGIATLPVTYAVLFMVLSVLFG